MGYDLSSLGLANVSLHSDLDPDAVYQKLYELNYKAWFSIDSWPRLLDLARLYGWKPMGTQNELWLQEENDEDWDGDYCTNDGQIVLSEDAAALADALEKAVVDIPDNYDLVQNHFTINSVEDAQTYLHSNSNIHRFTKVMLERISIGSGWSIDVPNTDLTLLEYFSGKEKQQVIGFIEFCRRGGFVIW
jgi:hypothetical protein